MLNIPAYLERIACAGPVVPTTEVLRDLHRAHMLSVPFENLDIALGRKIVCDEEAFIRKIVERRRGGFCYELNGAFAGLLRAIGFKVTARIGPGAVSSAERILPDCAVKILDLLLRDRVQTRVETGLVARCGVLVKHALLDRFVESGDRLPENLVGPLLVTFSERLTQVAQRAAQSGSVGAVASRAFLSLTGALQRRKMICH